ncbi:hypothetical protein HS041_22405 [Planomonospora sp. ID67723]|uniref:hypothetical protein n=1 Tax=Planomonospora sp. ID67723 TaxID=2738134 RepID=UPI0018C38B24|nr:hypothetical protein [Planomonospora sp. ID67723]MBG0830517.1 hypothetical protein [Planomonospora sp. ID67723]
MTTITNTLVDASGTPVPDVTVTARLIAASGLLTAGGEIIQAASTTTDENGEWSLTLTPVSALAYSTGAYYLIEEGTRRHTITVPATGTHPLADVIAEVPTERAEVGLSQADADDRYQQLDERGQPDGYASLDADGLVPSSQLPATASGVSSVNGETGVVVLTAADVGAATSGHTHTGVYDPAGTAASAVTAHEADTTNVHGIADTSLLETTAGATAKVSTHAGASDPHGDRAAATAALASHAADTTDVHGIADTSILETTTGAASKVSTHAAASDPHGDRAYADSAIATHAADTTSVHGIVDTSALETTSGATAKVSTHAAATDPHGDRAYADTLAGSLLAKALVDAKGDILVASAADTVTRLAVGTNGQILQADSAEATGLKWATPPAPGHPIGIYGFIAASCMPHEATAGGTLGGGTLLLQRVYVPPGQALTTAWVAIGSAATSPTAGQSLLGVYDDAGNKIAETADTPGLVTAAGWNSAAYGTPVAAQSAGRYVWLAALVPTCSVQPGYRWTASAGSVDILNRAGALKSVFLGSQTSLPATVTYTSASKALSIYMLAVS